MNNQPIRLFIADDHALFREGMRALLSATADIFCVGEAATGEDAVDKISACQPDVILMDINLPGINGIEATRRILRSHSSAGVIVVTMLEDDASIFAAMRAGARGYVLKGANHLELLQAIRAVAQGQVLFGPAIASRIAHFFTKPQPSQTEQSLPELSEREREILELMSRHYINPEIAQQLGSATRPFATTYRISSISCKSPPAPRPSKRRAKPVLGMEETSEDLYEDIEVSAFLHKRNLCGGVQRPDTEHRRFPVPKSRR